MSTQKANNGADQSAAVAEPRGIGPSNANLTTPGGPIQRIAGDVYLTPEAAGRRLGRGPDYVRRLCRLNVLPHVRVGNKFRIPEGGLRRFIATGGVLDQTTAPDVAEMASALAKHLSDAYLIVPTEGGFALKRRDGKR